VYKYRLRVKQLPISQFPFYPLIFTCKRSHVGLDLLVVVTVIIIHLLLKSFVIISPELHGFGDPCHHGSVHASG